MVARDNACPASDLRHAAVGIARQCFQACVEDRCDAPVGVCAATLGGGRLASRRGLRHRQWVGIALGLSRSLGTKWLARGRTARATTLPTVARSAAAMNACAIPDAACGPASTPLPAAIVAKIAIPSVPPIS